MSGYGWQVAIRDDMLALATDSRRVHIFRRAGDRVEVITEFDSDGAAVIQSFDAATVDPTGFLIPIDALEAIAELLKPGPSQGETRRLEEALAVERRRVDDVLAATRPPATPEETE